MDLLPSLREWLLLTSVSGAFVVAIKAAWEIGFGLSEWRNNRRRRS